MKLDRASRRLLERLQKAGGPQVMAITESIHILVQAGLIEYEAYQDWPNVVLVWAIPQVLDCVHDEYTWLASRKQKTYKGKEQTMAKVSIDVQDVTLGGGVMVGSAIISVEVPDDALAIMATTYERCLPLIFSRAVHTPHEHVCKCEASNGDKRPGTAATYRDRSDVN